MFKCQNLGWVTDDAGTYIASSTRILKCEDYGNYAIIYDYFIGSASDLGMKNGASVYFDDLQSRALPLTEVTFHDGFVFEFRDYDMPSYHLHIYRFASSQRSPHSRGIWKSRLLCSR